MTFFRRARQNTSNREEAAARIPSRQVEIVAAFRATGVAPERGDRAVDRGRWLQADERPGSRVELIVVRLAGATERARFVDELVEPGRPGSTPRLLGRPGLLRQFPTGT